MPRSNTCHGLKLDKPSFCLIDNSLSYSIFFLAFGLLAVTHGLVLECLWIVVSCNMTTTIDVASQNSVVMTLLRVHLLSQEEWWSQHTPCRWCALPLQESAVLGMQRLIVEQERILAGKPRLQKNSVHHDRSALALLVKSGWVPRV